jgi:hypothetical protein
MEPADELLPDGVRAKEFGRRPGKVFTETPEVHTTK